MQGQKTDFCFFLRLCNWYSFRLFKLVKEKHPQFSQTEVVTAKSHAKKEVSFSCNKNKKALIQHIYQSQRAMTNHLLRYTGYLKKKQTTKNNLSTQSIININIQNPYNLNIAIYSISGPFCFTDFQYSSFGAVQWKELAMKDYLAKVYLKCKSFNYKTTIPIKVSD